MGTVLPWWAALLAAFVFIVVWALADLVLYHPPPGAFW